MFANDPKPFKPSKDEISFAMNGSSVTHSERELKPCPFCGGEAELQQRVTESLWSHNQVTFSQVACSKCECRGEDCCEDEDGREASVAWNTRAAIPAASEPVGVPEGWKLVPVEPTKEMIIAGDGEYDSQGPTSEAIYSAMLAAAPQPEPGLITGMIEDEL